MAQTINVNTNPESFPATLYFSQGDIGREFDIILASSDGYTVPAGATVTMVATKPSGFGFSVAGTLTNNVASFVTTETMTNEAGRFPAEIRIEYNGDVIGTANFYLDGEPDPHPADTIDGDAETIIPELTVLVERVETAASSVLDMQVVATTLPAGSDATYSYDEATNTATFGIPKGADGTLSSGVLAPTYSTSATYAVGDYVYYSGSLYRCTTAITTAESWTAAHWTQVALAPEVTDLKSGINDVVNYSTRLAPYFYKPNIYINNSGVETTLSGYDTYKIPCPVGSFCRIDWNALSNAPWQGIQDAYAIKLHDGNGNFVTITSTSNNNGYLYSNNKEAIIFPTASTSFITLTIKRGNENGVRIEVDYPFTTVSANSKVDIDKTVRVITKNNAIKTQFYFNYTTQTMAVMGNIINNVMLCVKAGDVFEFTTIRSGTSVRATFRSNDGTMTAVGTTVDSNYTYTATADGVIAICYTSSETGDAICNPKTQISIDAKHIANLQVGTQFVGMDGVAFGTSLTYRKVSGNGYLNRLEVISGVEFDNQGVGSSTILGDGGALDMLAKIKAYTNYASKSICILEGFVNDWYLNKTLGTYTDETETTVCGCVRSALNYIMSQNAYMTLFLVLDHYGRDNSGIDCSTTAQNASNLTQYEFYEEIAKVANSLGVPVIKEYALSQISENTPQYLADNIHLNVLGATQSGNCIWSEMSKYYPNAQ